MCECKSYNWDIGEVPEKVLVVPNDIAIQIGGKPEVCVDDCIAHVIKHLWENKIVTFGSCCGHNKQAPSIIVEESCSEERANQIEDLIKQVDDRNFDLLSWKLMQV